MSECVRKLEYNISGSDEGMRVDAFLRERGFSSASLRELKKESGLVSCDSVPVHMNARLTPGSVLNVRICENTSPENLLPVPMPIDILYEDEDIIVINKAPGVPIHPSMNNYDNTLANALADYYRSKGRAFVFRCINRLDRDTSGITVIAKHYHSAGRLGEALMAGDFAKEYLAITCGIPAPPDGTIDAPIARRDASVIERVVNFECGESALTEYHVLGSSDGYALVRLIPHTGRTHQLRVHMKYLGYPLTGDFLYNPDYSKIKRQALHAWRLRFHHPISGCELSFEAPIPADMQWIISSNPLPR